MIVAVGSKNPVKINAVKNAFSHYFDDVKVVGVDAASDVNDQPMSAEETVEGAKNRARNAFANCDYAVGIEGGLIKYPTSTGRILTATVAIYDGKDFFLGATPLLDLPSRVVKQVLDGSELGPLFDKITGIENYKQHLGAVGFLTKGIIPREKALEQGIIMALCPLLNREIYQ